jgi:TolB protein
MASCEKNDSLTNSQLTGKIVGQITDARSNQLIPGVTVTTNPATQTVVTDSIGSFNISKVAAGHYTATGTKAGYAPGSVDVTARSETLVWVNIKPTPQ